MVNPPLVRLLLLELLTYPSIRDTNKMALDRLVLERERVHKLRCAKVLRPLLFRRIDIDCDNAGCTNLSSSIDDTETDASTTENCHGRVL
jgi:hypothetical protein